MKNCTPLIKSELFSQQCLIYKIFIKLLKTYFKLKSVIFPLLQRIYLQYRYNSAGPYSTDSFYDTLINMPSLVNLSIILNSYR